MHSASRGCRKGAPHKILHYLPASLRPSLPGSLPCGLLVLLASQPHCLFAVSHPPCFPVLPPGLWASLPPCGGMFARRVPGALLFYQLSRLQPQIYPLHSSQTATVEHFWQHNTHTSASSSASSCMPQPSKQLLNVCPIPPVHVIVTLLAGCQSAILSSNEWRNDMNPAFISTIMAPNFEMKEITLGTRRSIPIPNQNMC